MRRISLLLLCLPLISSGDTTSTSPREGHPPARSRASLADAGWEAPSHSTWSATAFVPGEHLVAPPAGTSLEALAAATGAEVVAPVGRSGFGVLRADGTAALTRAGARLAPLGRTRGTGKPASSKKPAAAATAPPAPPTWHLSAIGAPNTVGTDDWSMWRVAVLDSGVAYETSGPFVQAPGLVGVPFADPLDLVEGDGHPNDDHQHGTHITSLIASRGAVPGVVPGVTVIPVKVLDSTNCGTEYDLIEGIYHAIDHEADVINLSVSFELGYVPSVALAEALEAAWAEEVVVVAAAGNDGARELTWPAASRLVVSVGSSRSKVTFIDPTEYSNTSPALDILAPGGQLDVDDNRDGYIDGVVAETIDPADPASIGYWAYQGTSQSAALVSGLSVRLLAAGVAPHDIGPTLQQSAGGFDAFDATFFGAGADTANLAGALAAPAARSDYYVGLLPYLAILGSNLDPRARVTVVDASGGRVAGVEVLGSMYAEAGVWWPICVTDAEGTCTLQTLDFVDGTSEAWAFRIDAVVVDGVAHRPMRALWSADGTDALLTAFAAAAAPGDVLAIEWPEGVDDELGELAASWAVVDHGTGLLSSPLGVLFREQGVKGSMLAGELDLDVDGTGLLSSPLGTYTARTLTLGGTGLLSSPLGTYRLVGLSGTGLLSSPLGFRATSLYGSGDVAVPLDGSDLAVDARAFEPLLDDQLGAVTTEGYPGPSAVIGTGAVPVGLTTIEAAAPKTPDTAIRWAP